MLSRAAKSSFYFLASPLMRINALRYRLRQSTGPHNRAHLGPGQKNYLSGWINVDANAFTARCDIWADLRFPLPFRSDSLAAAYSHHVVEHLPNIEQHFREVYRCLKPGGVYRVAVPHGDNAIKKFVNGELSWFSIFPESRNSIGGRLDNFLLCRNEHLAILTVSYLTELLSKAGFIVVGECVPSQTTYFSAMFDETVLSTEHESDFEYPHTLVVEARKQHIGSM